MSVIESITEVLQTGGCVVMPAGVTPERYRLLLEGAANQDYVMIGPRDSADARFIASKMSGEPLAPNSFTMEGVEIEAYLVRSDR